MRGQAIKGINLCRLERVGLTAERGGDAAFLAQRFEGSAQLTASPLSRPTVMSCCRIEHAYLRVAIFVITSVCRMATSCSMRICETWLIILK